MSIFSLAEPSTPSFEALIAQCTKLRLAEQQAMIAEAEALLGKLAADLTCSPRQAYVPPSHEALVDAPAPKPRKARKPRGQWGTGGKVLPPVTEDNAPKLNAIGKPYSPQYDPKYRMNYRAGSKAHLFKPYSDKFRERAFNHEYTA